MLKETNKNIPKLRFSEFKGEWEKKKLGEGATFNSGKYNPEKEKNSVKCIELEHLAQESAQLLGYIDGKIQEVLKISLIKVMYFLGS
jgi:type I restriction enzyme S subunit